jgi:ceramide glucosyltransferase
MILTALQTILLVLIGSYLVWMVFAHLSTWFYFARYDRIYPYHGYEHPASIVKPVYGLDQSALENFRSFCNQDYTVDFEIYYCLEDPKDPAIPVIKRTIEEFPGRDIHLVFSEPKDTRSFGKVKNMLTGLANSSFAVVIFSDSDAHVPPTFLRDTVSCMQRPEIGLGFSAPALEGSENWAAALMNISVNELVLPVATSCLFGKFDGAIGTNMVTRREVIEQIGGLEQFGYQLTDDIPLGRAIHEKGYQIHLLKQPARVFHRRDSFDRWWSHMLRWLVIIHHYWPVRSFLKNLVMVSLWWSLLYLIISLVRRESVYFGVLLIVAVLATSLISTVVVNTKFVRCKKLWRFLWVVPILELARLPLIIHSYLINKISWRGRKLLLNTDGTMNLVDTPEGLS